MIITRGRRLVPAAVAVWAALLLAACQTGSGNSPTARASVGASSPSRAIAFESIDGPPQPVFNRLVASLTSEADARNVKVVSREANAGYRVRGYLAASVEDNKGTVDWAWDVFDKDRVRVLRVAGSEQVGTGADVWARCSDEVVNRIAAQSLTEIASKLGGAPPTARPAATQPAPEATPPAVREDDGPPVASVDPVAAPGDIAAGALALAPER
ncbi:MAG: hypothetical protein K0R27_2163 [Xanthobacteraceae bacterium]|jgi:hypothetical protein|nr:hypothetical protein [Xanthobacteraceae bacterium]